jgi:mono/diheme cytochrome c family protein
MRKIGALKKQMLLVTMAVASSLAAVGCGDPPIKTNAELGLNEQQAAGRAVFDHYCGACHEAYSSSGKKGPSLKNVFGKQSLPSGLPANDRFVLQTITSGRGVMPPFGETLTQDQIDSLLAYLHTL